MALPTWQEINPHDDLDGRAAAEHFYGKTLDDAEALLRDNPLYYQEDLMFMGPIAFRCYVHAVIRFLHSEAAAGDADFISCFARILQFRLENEPDELAPVAAELATTCQYVLDRWSRFDATPDTYGDLRGRYQSIIHWLARL